MTFVEVQDMAYEYLILHQLEDWRVKFNNRKRGLGLCIYRKKQIQLSQELVRSGNVEQIRETILHEIAHALVGPNHAHDEVWKTKAIEVGAKPVACAEVGAVPETGRGAKYRAECACTLPHFKYRKMRNPQARYKCLGCRKILDYKPVT